MSRIPTSVIDSVLNKRRPIQNPNVLGSFGATRVNPTRPHPSPVQNTVPQRPGLRMPMPSLTPGPRIMGQPNLVAPAHPRIHPSPFAFNPAQEGIEDPYEFPAPGIAAEPDSPPRPPFVMPPSPLSTQLVPQPMPQTFGPDTNEYVMPPTVLPAPFEKQPLQRGQQTGEMAPIPTQPSGDFTTLPLQQAPSAMNPSPITRQAPRIQLQGEPNENPLYQQPNTMGVTIPVPQISTPAPAWTPPTGIPSKEDAGRMGSSVQDLQNNSPAPGIGTAMGRAMMAPERQVRAPGATQMMLADVQQNPGYYQMFAESDQDMQEATQYGRSRPGEGRMTPEQIAEVFGIQGRMDANLAYADARMGTQYGMRPGPMASPVTSGAYGAAIAPSQGLAPSQNYQSTLGPRVGTQGLPSPRPTPKPVETKADRQKKASQSRANIAKGPQIRNEDNSPNLYDKETNPTGRVVRTAWGTYMDRETGMPVYGVDAPGPSEAEIAVSDRQDQAKQRRRDKFDAGRVANYSRRYGTSGDVAANAVGGWDAIRGGGPPSPQQQQAMLQAENPAEFQRQQDQQLQRTLAAAQILSSLTGGNVAPTPEMLAMVQPTIDSLLNPGGNLPSPNPTLSGDYTPEEAETFATEGEDAANASRTSRLAIDGARPRVRSDLVPAYDTAVENNDWNAVIEVLVASGVPSDEAYQIVNEASGTTRWNAGNPRGSRVGTLPTTPAGTRIHPFGPPIS